MAPREDEHNDVGPHEPTEASPLLPNLESPKSLADDSWWAEVWLLSQYSIPLIFTYLLQYSSSIITTFVAGHLSADDLAAASIGMTTMTIIGYSAFEGMATALDTLCAQAYGSGNLAGVGLHVQRMSLFMTLAMVPIALSWLLSPWWLSLFVKQQSLSVLAGAFLRVSIAGLPGYAFFEAGKRFLQAQGDFSAAMVVLVICTPVNVFLSWLFAMKLDMGLEGAALGTALTNNLRPLLLLLYVVMPAGRWSRGCWGGFSREAWAGWSHMVQLSVAGTAVNVGEWASYEVVALSTSYLSVNHLAAQTILTTVAVVIWHIPFSVSIAVSTRIGHLIGAGLLKTARRATVLYAVVFTLIGVLNGAVIFLLRNDLARFFSEDDVVCELAAKTMMAVSFIQIIDSLNCCTNGVIRGLGKQSVAAWVVNVVNYFAAVPLAIWLELGSPGLKLDGVWIGLGSGMVITVVVESLYMKMLRWQDCVDIVKLREGS
ncbi:MATE efflux family protein [Xylariaceae sp. FL0016]|nr:MATE efflux family protein [Xylariaceae sp. FL0016]